MLSQNDKSPVIHGAGDKDALYTLIALAKDGDNEAFAELYTHLYTPLYRYVLSRARDIPLTEDVCQQTFLKFYEALPTYIPLTSPLAYLFTIAKRLLINHGEKERPVFFDERLLENYEDTSHEIVKEEDIHLLAAKINDYLPSLTEDEQDVLRMYFYGELEYKEIAEALDKQEAAIRKIKERALKKLRILTHHLHDHE